MAVQVNYTKHVTYFIQCDLEYCFHFFLFHCKLLDQVNEIHIIVDLAEPPKLRYQTNTRPFLI